MYGRIFLATAVGYYKLDVLLNHSDSLPPLPGTFCDNELIFGYRIALKDSELSWKQTWLVSRQWWKRLLGVTNLQQLT